MAMPSAESRRTLVLGASGSIGRWVVHELVRRGVEVHAQVRDPRLLPPRLAAACAGVVRCDLVPRASAAELVLRLEPELVLNLVGYGVAKDERDERLVLRLGSEVVGEIMTALETLHASSPRVRLVQVGSALEYGPRPESLDERVACRPHTAYGRAKLEGTELALEARKRGLAALVARPFTVYGPHERPGRLVPTLLLARASQGRVALSSGEQRRDWIYVEDAARALVELAALDAQALLAGRPPFDAPALNLASGVLTSVRDFALHCAQALAIAPGRLGFGDLPAPAEELHHPPVPVERLRAALGWTPPADHAENLRRLLARVAEDGA
jgi:dTDP-glucose 4,6-dehydratase